LKPLKSLEKRAFRGKRLKNAVAANSSVATAYAGGDMV
jgi:hypothetical protein